MEGIVSGTSVKIMRERKEGDKIELQLDLRGRLLKLNGYAGIVGDPVVLTRNLRTKFGCRNCLML